MEIMLNGTPTHTQAASLAELLEEQGIATPGTAVAVNGKVVRRTEWNAAPLHDGASVTVIRATQGG